MEPTALLFQSDHFDLSWPKDVDPKEGDPWGKDCAAFLAEQLPRHGAEVPDPEPYWGEGGWYLDAVDAAKFNLFVVLWLVGKPPKEYWAIQMRQGRGVWGRLLGKKASEQAWKAIRAAVDGALSEVSFEDARWLSSDQLSSV